jgi:heme O synthase-like polyprenyltransferase
MNALVRTVLLVIIAFLMLVSLMLLVGEATGPIETIVLAVPAVLLVWAAFRVRRRAG